MSTADYQTFDLAGPHYNLGFVQGARTERFVVPAWWPAPPELSFAEACAQQMAEIHPPILEELRGYADGQRLPYEELLRGVCRRSMRLRAPYSAPLYPEGGCSSFALVDADGHIRVGRNYDFHPVQRVRQRVRLKPQQGRPSLGMRGSVPGSRYDGANDAGLFVSLHVALSDEPDDLAPGLPFHLLPRLVLETCATTREAVDLLTRVRHLHSFNYLLADAGGDLAVVEAHAIRRRVIEPERAPGGVEAFIACTNHFRHPEMTSLQRNRKLVLSRNRLAFLYAHAPHLTDHCSLLTDHPSSLCGHSGGHTTLWSLTADLTARSIAYARGAPCETEYEPVPWPGQPLADSRERMTESVFLIAVK